MKPYPEQAMEIRLDIVCRAEVVAKRDGANVTPRGVVNILVANILGAVAETAFLPVGTNDVETPGGNVLRVAEAA